MVEGVVLHHTVDWQGHHTRQAALVVHTDTQSNQLLCQPDIEQASFHLMVELVQLLAAGHMHSSAGHTHYALLHNHGIGFICNTSSNMLTKNQQPCVQQQEDIESCLVTA